MKKTLLLQQIGMISLSTLGTKGANRFSHNWNKSRALTLGLSYTTKLYWDIYSPYERCRLLTTLVNSLGTSNDKALPLLSKLPIDFIEWFRGFTDAEGCFLIVKTGNSYAFRFIIKIHKDDINVLYYIKNCLGGIGNIGTEEHLAHFKVTSLPAIKHIIEIFSTYPLNSSKHLDFSAFRKAYELYTSVHQESRIELLQEIGNIKQSMNSKRTEYKEELNEELIIQSEGNRYGPHKIHITDNWLLGFIEGDGSFSITKADFILTFSISQKGNLALMEAIKKYILNIPNLLESAGSNLDIYKKGGRSVVYLTKSKNKYTNTSEFTQFNYVLIIKSKDFVNNVLIPYLDSLTFHSKKELDYLDWKSINQLKNLGLHYSLPLRGEEGIGLITLIINQMNNNRLSNSSEARNTPVNREYINNELTRLLNGPSNYEIIKGRKFIKSLNKFLIARVKTQVILKDKEGLTFKTFESMNNCAKFLGVSTHTVSKRIRTGSHITLNNKEYLIIKTFND